MYSLLYEFDSEKLAFEHLSKSLKLAIELENETLICEVIKTILIYYDKLLNIKDGSYKYYLEIYEKHCYDKLEKQILNFFKIRLSMFYKNYELNEYELEELRKIANEINHNYYRGRSYLTLGVYHENYKGDFVKSSNYYHKGLDVLSKRNEGVYAERTYAAKINLGKTYYESKEYNKAISLLTKADVHGNGKSIQWVTIFKHIWLSNSYKKIGDTELALKYLDSSRVARNKFNQGVHNEVATKIAIKEGVLQKERKISTLQGRLYSLIPFLVFTTFILVLVFFLYKKYKKTSQILAEEKSETLEKLDELKSIVIKNHVVLKDKTKVYISDLIYLKSDDHYLNIFTSNGKNHFVRGKLSKIKEELPPNFIQCHRSYIVNSNFIKQINKDHLVLINKESIPLSRSFKNNF